MVKAQKIALIVLLLLLPFVNANLLDRMSSTENIENNNICDDGEYPWDKDCKGKDITEQIGALKLLLIGIILILIWKRKNLDWKIIAAIAIIMFILLNLNMEKFSTEKPKEINTTETKYSCLGKWCYAWHGNTTFKSNSTLMKAGEIVYGPSHPERGVIIIIIFLVFITLVTLEISDKILDWINDKLSRR